MSENQSYLLEPDAREKWCPFVRTAWALNASDESAALCTANRGNTDNNCRCVASDCMQWRWANPYAPRGYCGLGGRPQL